MNGARHPPCINIKRETRLHIANCRFHRTVFTLCSDNKRSYLKSPFSSVSRPPFSPISPLPSPPFPVQVHSIPCGGREAIKACKCPVNCLFIKMSSQPDSGDGVQGSWCHVWIFIFSTEQQPVYKKKCLSRQ